MWALLRENHDWLAADFAEQAAERAREAAARAEEQSRVAAEAAAAEAASGRQPRQLSRRRPRTRRRRTPRPAGDAPLGRAVARGVRQPRSGRMRPCWVTVATWVPSTAQIWPKHSARPWDAAGLSVS